MQKLALKLLIITILIGCSKRNESEKRILIVTSNQHTYRNTKINASNHFAEIVWAYDVFVKNGYSVDFVSPKGGAIPIGYIATSDSIQKKYLYDNAFMNVIKSTKQPKDVNPLDYKAIYYSGGGAAMFGVAENSYIQTIAESIYNANGIVSAVCHGTAGLVNLKDEKGISLYHNKKISGYPDVFENKEATYYKSFPFSIEEKIKENNGNFLYSKQRNDNFYVIDGNFITGQDPSATTSVAEKVVEALENQKTNK
ncbi:type 1 glutamine amidotransferase domain-containing protein [Aquimarina sp. 2201CG5-10]|uniref:type 1 glutamine amidotransferase domain-containing protein n=1 Tax=Aquimarina callyspongiae TaxID=3098150 RepID=UPI002AB35125|nr:type 1 glutamine amidotransferase domain-containing protein [Aquimarina sp. 2201CG5-10]MDY8137701.1 type 1 glutamine amidotransferase domain-containing protein [Aquimarina sp. 2201CG5-10]